MVGPLLEFRGATLRYGTRTIWEHLDLAVSEGEFVAVLGPNGVGKTSLLRVGLGLLDLTQGEVRVLDERPRRGSTLVGYVAQQRPFDPAAPIRGKDLVRLGLDGNRWGVRLLSSEARRAIAAALDSVDAATYADAPVGLLSGGEQQRLRLAQALVSEPRLLLCDEPLLSLDLAHQRTVVAEIDRFRRSPGRAVIFVTHEINPILPVVDRVLYLAPDSWEVGTPDRVLTSPTLTRLFRTPVDVLRVRDRIVVVGAPDEPDAVLGEVGHTHRPLTGMA